MGFAYLGIGLGGAAVPWISRELVKQFGWQAALRLLGLLIIVIALPSAFFTKEEPSPNTSRERNGSPAHDSPRRDNSSQPIIPPLSSGSPCSTDSRVTTKRSGSRSAFLSVPFFLIALGSMFSIAAVSGTQQNLKLFLSLDLHFTQSGSARILSLVLAFSIVGRLLMGWLADRFPKKYVMLLIYLLIAAAIPLLFAGRSRLALFAFAAIFGIGLGGDYMIVPLITAEIFGVQLLGRLLGVILTAGSVAEALSPWLVGRLRDVTGSYSSGFLALIGMGLLGAVAAAALPKEQGTA